MTQEHSPNEMANCDSGDGTTKVVSAGPLPEDYCSALSQLNELEALGEIKDHNLDLIRDHCGTAEAPPDASIIETEIASADAEPTDKDLALTLLNELCASVEGGTQSSDVMSEYRDERTNCNSRGETSEIVSVGATPADYQSALLQIIESVTNDPGELRRLVYELARTNLKSEISRGGAAPTPDDVRSLETAIAHVEVDLSQGERSDRGLPQFEPGPAQLNSALARDQFQEAGTWLIAQDVTGDIDAASIVRLESEKPRTTGLVRRSIWPANVWEPRSEVTVLQRVGLNEGSAEHPPVEILNPERDKAAKARAQRRVLLWFIVWPLIQLIGPAVFCLALYMALAGRLDVPSAQTRQAGVEDVQQRPSFESVRPSGLPLPSTYGVYAISMGYLSELQPLPIRAPDPRVQLSAEISKPSSSVLPDGKIAFVFFRRELVNSAPQKVAVRVVARVASRLTFSSGKAAALKPDASWRIRGNSYDFQVSPLSENREMVVARPQDPERALPSGRYALIFEGLAYDFTVDGPIAAPEQCLESFEAVNGPVFTECRPK